ncbi:helix-turn-helix domain-containing protein [Sphaerochaeta sp.]|uniref:helix-turn-helix domain-containing protein n=1 Tax=Sphaerochaeta sp. TaxID=1972642 RepID=UPI003FA72D15
MHFQQALVYAMNRQHVSLSELAARTGANPRWLTEITTNAEWRPKLDTILRLCHALRFNVLDYLTYAEADSCGQAPSSKLQAPSSKLQAPSCRR